MEHIAAIMLLVGCSQGSLTCEELPAPQAAYESMNECTSALPLALGGVNAGKRTVHARCAAFDPAWEEEDVDISWRMDKKNGLQIDIRPIDPSENVIVAENAVSNETTGSTH